MFGKIEGFYEALATGSRKLYGNLNSPQATTIKGAIGVGLASKVIASSLKVPNSVADKLYPNSRMNIGGGNYGLGSGGTGQNLGSDGLKFSFRKK